MRAVPGHVGTIGKREVKPTCLGVEEFRTGRLLILKGNVKATCVDRAHANVPTHSLNEDFPNAHATADLSQALFHRLRNHAMSNISSSGVTRENAPLPRAKWTRRRSFPQTQRLRTSPPTCGQYRITGSPGRIPWAFRRPWAQQANDSGLLRRADG